MLLPLHVGESAIGVDYASERKVKLYKYNMALSELLDIRVVSELGRALATELKDKLVDEIERGRYFLLVDGGVLDYGPVFNTLGYKATKLFDLLKDREDKLRNFMLTPEQVYLLASGKKLPLSVERSSGSGIKLSVGGVGLESNKSENKSTDAYLDRNDLKYILSVVVDSSDERDTRMILLSGYELKILGDILHDVTHDKVRFVVGPPTAGGGKMYYKVLGRQDSVTMFAHKIGSDEVSNAIMRVFIKRGVKLWTNNIRDTVTLLANSGLITGSINYITKNVGNNPFMALKASLVLLAYIYSELGEAPGRLLPRVESDQGFRTRLIKIVLDGNNFAISQVVGVKSNMLRNYFDNTMYANSLAYVLKSMSNRELRELRDVLNQKSEDPYYARILLNIGAIRLARNSIVKTRIGEVVDMLILYILKHRERRARSRQ